MRPLIRLMLWILIAALPLQGVAAIFIPCVAAQAHVQVATQPAAGAQHCAPAKSDLASGAHGKCSHCASCVGACAPPSVPALVLPACLSGDRVVAPEPAMTAYIPATLERPPRLS